MARASRQLQRCPLELTRGKRAEGQTCIAPKGGSANFGDAAERHISHLAVSWMWRSGRARSRVSRGRPVAARRAVIAIRLPCRRPCAGYLLSD